MDRRRDWPALGIPSRSMSMDENSEVLPLSPARSIHRRPFEKMLLRRTVTPDVSGPSISIPAPVNVAVEPEKFLGVADATRAPFPSIEEIRLWEERRRPINRHPRNPQFPFQSLES
jgi:hypothetical protein